MSLTVPAVNQAFVFEEEANSVSDQPTFSEKDAAVLKRCKNHMDTMLSSLGELKRDENFCDVTMNVGESQIKAHRTVLASMSKYFKAMFLHETKESESGVINFDKMEPEILEKCIDFIYSGTVEISMEDVRLLLDASEMMELHGLSELCVEFLAERVNMSTCAEVINLCYSYKKDSLNLPICQFLTENFKQFTESEDFLSLDADLVEFCLTLLLEGNEELEIAKWKAVIAWIQNDANNRVTVLPKLFNVIDLSTLSIVFIKEQIYSHPIIQDSKECLSRISAYSLGDDEAIPKKRRKTMRKILARKLNCKVISQYDLITKEWSPLTSIPCEGFSRNDFILHKGDLYIATSGKICRYSGDEWSSIEVKQSRICNSEYICKRCNSYTNCQSYTYGNKYCRCVGSGNYVYVLTNSTIIEWNILTSEWTRRDSKNGLGDGFFVTVSDKKIYMMGGKGQENKAYEFDLTTKRSIKICDMLTPKSTGHAIWVFQKLYAFGGEDWPSSVEYYDPTMDIWTLVPKLTIRRSPANVYVGDKLYLFGGDILGDYETVDLDKFKIDDSQRHFSLADCRCFGTGF